MRRQWPELLERFPNNTIVRMVGSITTLTTPHLVADVQSFFAEHPIPQAAKTLEQLLERQRVNADLRAREADVGPGAAAGRLGELLDVELVVGVAGAQHLLVELADAGLGHLGDERPPLRQPELRRCARPASRAAPRP